MSSHDSVVSVDDVSVHFNDGGGLMDLFSETQTVRAVDGISLDVGEKDVVTLIGESGCGKSTLGKTIIGAQKPTEGTVSYRGQDIWEARDSRNPKIPFSEIRRSLQIIHQDPGSALNPNQRIRTSLMLPLKKWNPDLSDDERKKRVYALLDRVGLSPPEDFVERFPHQLSGGEQQRVVLVRSLLLNPDVILADEAISALDVSLRVDMMDLMLELQETFDTSFVFISHDLSNARYIAEKSGGRIAVMYLGKIVEVGPIGQVIENPQHPYTKALKWATPNLYGDESDGDLPIRKIDIPDPTNRPTGCHFHPRCPEARETCREQDPPMFESEDHLARCFRADESHEYWQSQPIVDEPTADH